MPGHSDTLITMKQTLILIALLIAGCADKRPQAPTAEENRQLDEADAMLNVQAASNSAAPLANDLQRQ